MLKTIVVNTLGGFMKKKILIVLIGLVVITCWSLLFVFNKSEKPVIAEKVAYRDLKKTIELTGKVISKNIYTVASNTV